MSPYEKIDAVLCQVACELPRRPDWYQALARLGNAATPETRLQVYQAVRDEGCLPEDASFFLMSFAINELIEHHGLSAWKHCFFDLLTAQGESEMADLFKRYGEEFVRREAKGRRFFFEPQEPGAARFRCAVQELYDHVGQCVGSRAPMGPLACRWSVDYGFIDLQIFPTPLELVGGPNDGAVIDPDVDFDLLRIQEAFDSLDGVSWTLDGDERECHYICLRGIYRGLEIWVTLFAGAPLGEKPTMRFDELRARRAIGGGEVN